MFYSNIIFNIWFGYFLSIDQKILEGNIDLF